METKQLKLVGLHESVLSFLTEDRSFKEKRKQITDRIRVLNLANSRLRASTADIKKQIKQSSERFEISNLVTNAEDNDSEIRKNNEEISNLRIELKAAKDALKKEQDEERAEKKEKQAERQAERDKEKAAKNAKKAERRAEKDLERAEKEAAKESKKKEDLDRLGGKLL